MKMSIRFEGGAELAATLQQLAERANKRVSKEALTVGAEPIRAMAAQKAPRRSPKPDLADNIVIGNQRVQQDETAAVSIGPAKGFAYGLPQEIGTAFHGAQPFMRPAFDSKMSAALDLIRAAYWTALAAVGISRSVSSDSGVEDSAFDAAGVGRGRKSHGRKTPLSKAGSGGLFG